MRTTLRCLLVMVLALVSAELIVGYFSFRRLAHKRWILPELLGRAFEKRISTPLAANAPPPPRVYEDTTEINPFARFPWPKGSLKLHPLIDFTSAYSKFPHSLDYFGFRNREDLYLSQGDYRLVVLTGGSEVAGFSHATPISEHLERILTEKSGQKYKVLNLGMCGYTTSNEMNAFVHLAYFLNPKAVISYSGYNDLFYGLMVPPRFKKLGLGYNKTLEMFLHKYHYPETTKYLSEPPWMINPKGEELLVDAYLRNMEKYKAIVESSGVRFIPALQAHAQGYQEGNERDRVYHRLHALYAELVPKAKRNKFLVVEGRPEIRFVDSAHSDEASSRKLGELFATAILQPGAVASAAP